MNIYNEAITGITTPEKSTVDYIHCIVHTILFHRTILSIETPQEVKMKTLDFHYVTSSNPPYEQKLKELITKIKPRKPDNKFTIFIDLKTKKQASGLYMAWIWGGGNEGIWEQWKLEFQLVPNDQFSTESQLEKLRDTLNTVISKAGRVQNKDFPASPGGSYEIEFRTQ